jgi:hypothetical protein
LFYRLEQLFGSVALYWSSTAYGAVKDVNKRLIVSFALIALMAVPAATIYALQNRPSPEPGKGALDVAMWFLMNSPTFKFDGIADSISVIDTRIMESYPVQYVFVITFECGNAGYSDRTGQMLAEVITPHEAVIKVVEGVVVSAVIDGVWDELDQRDLTVDGLLTPDEAVELAVWYVLDSYALGIEVPEEWSHAVVNPEGLLGYSVQQFTGCGWVVNVSFPVVMKPTYIVSIRYNGAEGFEWEGTVDQSGNVEETSTSLSPPILLQEDARDIVVAHLIGSLPELRGHEAPEDWTVTDLTPEGLLGLSISEFTSGSWTVRVRNPVVWKPTYEVEVEYASDPALTWQGTVDQSGSVEAQ